MRGIKFRAWIKPTEYSDGEMVDVDNIQFRNNDTYSVNGAKLKPKEKQPIIINVGGGWRTEDEIELMQFTGLTDKNGVEIFEGDILAFYFDEGRIFQRKEVAWNKLDASFFGVDIEDKNKRSRLAFSLESCWKVEVIGNIYENPEVTE